MKQRDPIVSEVLALWDKYRDDLLTLKLISVFVWKEGVGAWVTTKDGRRGRVWFRTSGKSEKPVEIRITLGDVEEESTSRWLPFELLDLLVNAFGQVMVLLVLCFNQSDDFLQELLPIGIVIVLAMLGLSLLRRWWVGRGR